MSMTHLDRIEVPFPAQVSALLTQIAACMFENLINGKMAIELDEETFEAWKLIRSIAHLYGTRGLQVLEIDFQDKFVNAIVLAHRVYHCFALDTTFPGACDCPMATLIHPLATLMLQSHVQLLERR